MNVIKSVVNTFCILLLFVSTLSISAGPTYDVFSEGFGAGWTSQPWGATVTEISPTNPFKGKSVAQVEFTSSMGVFKPVATGGFSTLGYKHIIFAVFNYNNADDLWFVAQTTGGASGTYLKVADYADKWNLPQGKWSWVRIPVNKLGLGDNPTLSFFSVASGKAYSVAYFDDVGFAASSVIFEGAKDLSYAPGMQLWYWGGNITKTVIDSVGNYSIRMNTTSAWGGVQFQHRVGNLKTTDYGAVSVRIKTADLYKANLFSVYLTDVTGKTIGVPIALNFSRLPSTVDVAQNNWFHFTIKMSDFAVSSSSIGGVIIQAVEPTIFYVDDVRFVQKFNWAMDVARSVTGFEFGAVWLNKYCDATKNNPRLHTGNDYSDGANVNFGTSVYAVSRGVVKDVLIQDGWGQAVIIQHESGLTTSYLHLDTVSVSKGSEIRRGMLLGKTTALDSGSHLHFGVRTFEYDLAVSQAGALFKNVCGADDKIFSNYFIDSERMDWNTK